MSLRKARLQHRLARINKALAYYDEAQESEIRGRFVTWATKKAEEAGYELDSNDDGAITADELEDLEDVIADALESKIDLPQPFDSIANVGVRLALTLVVSIILKRRDRLERRKRRVEQRLAQL